MALSRDEAVAVEAARGLGGGYIQRLERGQSSHRSLQESPLSTSLVEMWSMGLMSSPCVHKLALAGVEELSLAAVSPHPTLQALASIGTSGEHCGNCRRDLVTRYPVSPHLPKPLEVDVPALVHPAGGIVEFANVPIVMPYELFHCLWQNFSRQCARCLGARLEKCWNSVHPEANNERDDLCL